MRVAISFNSLLVPFSFHLPCGICFLSFALMQKKQKIKNNPIRPGVCSCLRSAKATSNYTILDNIHHDETSLLISMSI